MDREVERSGSRRVYGDPDGRWCDVFLDTYRLPSGQAVELHRVRVGGGRTGVVVLARRGDRLLMVRQWRPAVGRWAWELPRGFGESDPVADALRELAEETGIEGCAARVLARLDVDSGLLESEAAVVEVTVPDVSHGALPDEAVPAGGDGEVADARWWSRRELAEAVRRGEVRDAFTLAALGVAATYG
ncbi:NUDIX hydrolase [Streptomyces sp. NPDC054887]